MALLGFLWGCFRPRLLIARGGFKPSLARRLRTGALRQSGRSGANSSGAPRGKCARRWSPEAARVDPVLADLVVEDPLGGAEQPRGLGAVPARGLQRVQRSGPSRTAATASSSEARGHRAGGLGGLQGGRQVVAVDDAAVADQHRALDDVLQLAHVAGPVVADQHVDGGGGDAPDALAVLARVLGEEVVGEQQDVRLPLAQRRHEDGEDVEPVVEVLAEGPLGDGRLEVLVGGGDEPDVGRERLGSAQRSNSRSCRTRSSFTCVEGLTLADLVEEQRAALGQLEAAPLARLRAGEGALLVAEQLGLDQRLRQRRAVDLDERLLRRACEL